MGKFCKIPLNIANREAASENREMTNEHWGKKTGHAS